VPEPPRRDIYLLIVWQERPPSLVGPAIWRFSLENVRTGQRHGFCSLERMSAFLEDRTTGGIVANRMDAIPQGKGETDEDPTP
jgi:hypothetical protein